MQLYLEVMDWDKLYCDAHARNDVYIDDFSNEIQYNGGTYNGNQNDFGCMGSK